MTEMPLFLDKVPKGAVRSLPGDDTVETGQGFPGRTDLGLRHPFLECGPVKVEVRRDLRPRHVRNNSMFINNEQLKILNPEIDASTCITTPSRPSSSHPSPTNSPDDGRKTHFVCKRSTNTVLTWRAGPQWVPRGSYFRSVA